MTDNQDVNMWPKTCACGRSYSPAEWAVLEVVGQMVDPEETLELRNCPCGSTIAVVVQ